MNNSIFTNNVATKTISGARYSKLPKSKKPATKAKNDYKRTFGDISLENDTLKTVTDLSILNFIGSVNKSLYIKTIVGLLYINDNKSVLENNISTDRIYDFTEIKIDMCEKISKTIGILCNSFDVSKSELLQLSASIGEYAIKNNLDAEIRSKALIFKLCL